MQTKEMQTAKFNSPSNMGRNFPFLSFFGSNLTRVRFKKQSDIFFYRLSAVNAKYIPQYLVHSSYLVMQIMTLQKYLNYDQDLIDFHSCFINANPI